ncbi:thioesterase family protein [Bdellovibrio sp. NC01]|uniref:acyl-CoA thioesterase n=1 Tax=Bdellovibrio sp. NC01 TaxID=2220073 RepID=UPI001158E7AE|nr:acyl-CoA thioesterase [Bdellovibrio sp. NC01]QDK36601.1 acyl-CoA thioesterase [Bdellovibrio sp. NC01]
MNQIFKTKKTLTFREADPAKIMFFGNIFGFAHDAFEQFILEAGYTWKEYFQDPEYAIPLRHTESNYLAPFFPGETYDIAVTVASFGETSFKMKYVFSQKDKVHAVVTMVHSVLDLKTKQKTALPDKMKTRFGKYLETPSEVKA